MTSSQAWLEPPEHRPTGCGRHPVEQRRNVNLARRGVRRHQVHHPPHPSRGSCRRATPADDARAGERSCASLRVRPFTLPGRQASRREPRDHASSDHRCGGFASAAHGSIARARFQHRSSCVMSRVAGVRERRKRLMRQHVLRRRRTEPNLRRINPWGYRAVYPQGFIGRRSEGCAAG